MTSPAPVVHPAAQAHVKAAAQAAAASVAHTVAAAAAEAASAAHTAAASAAASASSELSVLTGEVKTTLSKVVTFVKAHWLTGALGLVAVLGGIAVGRVL